MAIDCQTWPRNPFTDIVAINNSWRVRPDWDYLIHPDDLPADKLPPHVSDAQHIITSEDYVPEQNSFGGFVYAGGTMAFTAGYWALAALKPDIMAFFGCDMVYPASGNTHFYGTGQPDPLRVDISLRNLEAKSARLMLMAAQVGCQCLNLSTGDSRLVFPTAQPGALPDLAQTKPPLDLAGMDAASRREDQLAYFVPSGRYWTQEDQFDPDKIDALDQLWLDAHSHATGGR